MAEEHRGRDEVGRVAVVSRWLRAIIEAARRAGRPPRRRTPRIRPVRRSRLGASWQARSSVRAGIGVDEFLTARLARYLAQLPVARAELPLWIDVADGQVAWRRTGAPTPAPARGAREDPLAPLVALDDPGVLRELSELEARRAALSGEIADARRRAEGLSRALDADVADGSLEAAPGTEVTAEQLGRPPIPSAAPRTAALAFAAGALAAESWQIAIPLLRGAGLDPAHIGAEALRRPADAAFLALLALGVAAGIFALAHAALGSAVALFGGDLHDDRRRWLASGALAAGLLATLVAAAVAALNAAGARSASGVELVVLLVAVPLASSVVLRAAAQHERQRAREKEAALAWDRERTAAIAERVRRDAELAAAIDDVRALEQERDLAAARLRDLERRATTAARLEAEAEQRRCADLARLAQSIVDALELDRYELIRQASRRARDLAARDRAAFAGPRPPAFEAFAPARARSELEKGRLAS